MDRLERIIDEVGTLLNKLVLLVGAPGGGKSTILSELGRRRAAPVLNVGSQLGTRLAVRPVKQRALAAATMLRELAEEHAAKGLLLFDNIELLFDRTLQLDPLDLLKQLSRARKVVAVWPGQLRDGRLIYAEMGHPEHQDYSLEGLVTFEIQ